MRTINELLRPHIKSLKPYSSARDEFSGQASVYLDANENPYGSISGGNYNRYPDPLQKEVKQKLAMLKGVEPTQIFMGNGSDEGIDLLIRAFCRPGHDQIVIMPPTYGMYEVSASIHDVGIVSVPLSQDFQPLVEDVLGKGGVQTKILFVCSPNNPSGNDLEQEKILALIRGFDGIVVVDEAYIDFSESESFIKFLPDFPNLVVLQTFSKAWGMAALRLGLAYASEEIIDVLNKIKPPYNINIHSQQMALQALNNADKVAKVASDLVSERTRLSKQLQSIGGIKKVYPSNANFILVKMANASAVYKELLNEGIVVRDRSKVILCDDCLRITVGTVEENEKLIRAFGEIVMQKLVDRG